LRRTLLSIAERDESGVTPVSTLPLLTGAAWAEDVRDVPPRSGIPAPALPTIDDMGGLVEGDLVILAGRPGMGKSTVAWNVAVDVGIKQNVPTLLFSTEMTRGDVARWIGTCLHRVPPRALSQSQWQQTLQSISRSAITICDKGLVSSTDVMQAVKDQQPRLVIIDHLQRLLHKRGGENRNRELEEIASLCKGLAKDYHCTFIVLSQLNRMSAREARRPEQYDLRDSGGIEQEADGIIFLWTPELDLTHALLPMRFYLAKNRHGMIREQSVIFDKELKRFVADHGIANAYAAVRHTETLNDDD
jgi:replicative DNA helicase